jgi:hypothetical protein
MSNNNLSKNFFPLLVLGTVLSNFQYESENFELNSYDLEQPTINVAYPIQMNHYDNLEEIWDLKYNNISESAIFNDFISKLINDSKDIDESILKIINDRFWDLI